MLQLPYGSGFLTLEEGNAQVLRSRIEELSAGEDGRGLVRRAMDAPIGSPRLEELARGKKTCTVIISDHTRPVPSQDILPEMLADLRRGNPEIQITLLVATGCHRATSAAELEKKLGAEIFGRETIVVHDCADAAANVQIGVLPSGAPLVLDRLAVETDLLVSEGFIEPHFFAGFSGGRKSVLPGVCDRVTVLGNHCGEFIASDRARTGILDGNPIHRDMTAAARMAGLAFIVNVVIDGDKRTAAAFAGDPLAAHEAGCRFLAGYCQVEAKPADIVITTNGGAPLDQNLYQCVKGMTAAEAAAKPGGVVILAAEAADGHGGEHFYQTLRDCQDPAELYDALSARPQAETIPDQWQSQILLRILRDHPVIFVTRPELRTMVEEMNMRWAGNLEDALTMARAIRGADASLTVIPDGVSLMVIPKPLEA